MLAGAVPTARTRQQRVEQLAQQWRGPAAATAQQLLQLQPELLHFLERDLLRSNAEDALDFIDRSAEAGARCTLLRRAIKPGFRCAGAGLIKAQLKFQQPALRRRGIAACILLDLDAVQFQRAQFAQRRRQPDLDLLCALCCTLRCALSRTLACALTGLQHHRDRRQRDQVGIVRINQGAERRDAAGCRGDQVKTHRLSHPQREGMIRQHNFTPHFAAARQDADRAPGHTRFFRTSLCCTAFGRTMVAQHQKIAARGAAADAGRAALAGQGIGDCAARHRHFGIVVVQQMQRRAAPASERVAEAAHQRIGAKHATVEQQGIRQKGVRQTNTLLLQEAGDMARDRRVAGVGQAELDQTAAAAARHIKALDFRKKPIDDQVFNFCAL